ncbi:hypothetical protein C8Q72DRAFT_456176 [Fomitopsis betulina]|nr:hypothetical protein C8Q72DRAFT_456176 [Fomitopsis betulina]
MVTLLGRAIVVHAPASARRVSCFHLLRSDNDHNMGGANYMGGKRNFVKARAKDATGKAQRNHFGKQRLGILTKGLGKTQPEVLKSLDNTVNVVARISLAHAQRDIRRTRFTDTSSADDGSVVTPSAPHSWHLPDISSSTSSKSRGSKRSKILNALDMSVPISLRAEMDRIRSTPNLAGLIPKAECRLHLTDYRDAPEYTQSMQVPTSPANSPLRRKRKMSTSPDAEESGPSSPPSLSLHLQTSSPHRTFSQDVDQAQSGIQRYKEGNSTPFGTALRRPQYISQINLSSFAHTEPGFEPMSLDSSPPRQRNSSGSVASELLCNLPTRYPSMDTVETTPEYGRLRQRNYDSQTGYDRPRLLSPNSHLSRPTKIRKFSGGPGGADVFSRTPGSLGLSLGHRSLIIGSPGLDSPGDLSWNSSQSALAHLTLCPADTFASPGSLDDALCGASEEDYVPAVSSGPYDTDNSALIPSSGDVSYLSSRLTGSRWAQPSHASRSTRIASQNDSSPPTRLSYAMSFPTTPSLVTPECSPSATYELGDGNAREESLYDALHGQLFEGADPWLALDGVLGLQPQRQLCADVRTSSYGVYREATDTVATGQDQKTEPGYPQLEQVAYADVDETDDEHPDFPG